MRVGFLFNHYAEHQVPHAAPYAFELSRRQPEIDVILACSTMREMRMVRAIAALYPDHRCSFRRLHLPWRDRLSRLTANPWELQRKVKILSHNLDFFRSLDALVTPEQTSLKLRFEMGLRNLILIHTRHGAGDAKGGFDDRSERFDFTLLPGQKHVDRMKAMGVLKDGKYAVVGFPKFEVVQGLQRSSKRLFKNDKPIVVYNPHFKRRISSWHSSGKDILNFFASTDDYNLIFAPHVLLFKKAIKRKRLLKRCQKRPNILIDTGSSASVDMTYTLAADIYLGDVSSQIYDFLLHPRPCVFVNARNVAWQNDEGYAHWHFGAVIDDARTDLGTALGQAKKRHGEFIDQQKAAFRYTFQVETDRTAAQRGADAIATFLRGANQASHHPVHAASSLTSSATISSKR